VALVQDEQLARNIAVRIHVLVMSIIKPVTAITLVVLFRLVLRLEVRGIEQRNEIMEIARTCLQGKRRSERATRANVVDNSDKGLLHVVVEMERLLEQQCHHLHTATLHKSLASTPILERKLGDSQRCTVLKGLDGLLELPRQVNTAGAARQYLSPRAFDFPILILGRLRGHYAHDRLEQKRD
jgi:hypothetical protein